MTSYFKQLCEAFYIRTVHKSKPKFMNSLLRAAGNNFGITDNSHANKIFNGTEPFTDPIRESFSATEIDHLRVARFFEDIFAKHKEGMRLIDLANNAGIEGLVEVDATLFFQACAALVNAEIFGPPNSISLTSWYELAGDNSSMSVALTRNPLFAGDAIAVSKPPALQQYLLPHWEFFNHQWVLQNRGNVVWRDRFLICKEPKIENGIRLSSPATIPIPQTAPREFVKLTATFQTRGHDGVVVSPWRMVDTNGQDCFPNHPTDFDVRVAVSFRRTVSNGGLK